ncbi:MAG: cyclase family protein, partial [Atribacterota bacterium]
ARPDFVYVEEPGARFLSQQKLKGVGIDALGIERNQPGHPTHRLLLEKEVLIYEGLDLRRVTPGKYYFFAFPLKIKGADGSPVRALLKKVTHDG